MQASEIMTRQVVAVAPDTPLREVARVLLDHGISAAPVVDPAGTVIGMVSEGDLIGRNDANREARRDWWLALLAEGEALHPDFLASLRGENRTARDIMVAPVVAVAESATAREIAQLLAAYRIKRVPVLHDGRIVGIVSRADLLRGLGQESAPAPHHRSEALGMIEGAISKLDERFLRGNRAASADASGAPAEPPPAPLTVDNFKQLVTDFEQRKAERHDDARRASATRRQEEVRGLIDLHIGDPEWKALMHGACEAAEHGAKEFELRRFPCELCTDGGRAINVPSPDWPTTLRGEAAEIYLRWERDLKPHGFHLTAHVLDFPEGKPGEIGMFLVWGG